MDFQFEFHQISEEIYLGPEIIATKQPEKLEKLGITHILNITLEGLTPFPEKFKYKTIKIGDIESANIKEHFETAFQFISKAIEKSKKVYVHCNGGISRSATIVIYFLMRFNKISLKDSFELVKKKRPEICPNKSFFRQLIESEKELFNPENPSIAYNDYLVLLIQHSLPDLSVEQIKEAFLLSDQDVIKTETFLLKKYFGLK